LISVIILTKNEALHLARALDSVSRIATDVFVVDSYSTDETMEIAKQKGATVLTNKFINYATQFQWALDNAPIKTTWVMRLDADEIIEDDLQEEILNVLPTLNTDIAGINLKRKHIFMNRWVRFGGRYPLVLLRIWRHGQGRIEQRWMDEHMVVWDGRVVTLNGGFADHNLKDLTFFTEKHNWYATREAVDVINQRLGLFERDEGVKSDNSSFQASAKRFIKERIYNRIPFTVSSTAYFLFRYVIQLGFLDGRSGLVYHFLQGYWYRFLVGAKIMELEEAIKELDNKDAIIDELARLTGFKLR
jgi:glycosyltransferase involved in cell wall biosynthesis